MNPSEKAHSIISNFSTNVFSVDGISKVYWREYKGCIPSISSCVEEFQNADQACFACLGELAGPLSTRYHQQHEEASSANPSNKPSSSAKGVSRLEDDILHLYIFSWSSESQEIQNAILDRYIAPIEPNTSHSGEQIPSRNLELLSSGEWLTNGGYSINEAPRKPNSAPATLLKPFVSSAGPTVPHTGRTAALQTPLFVSHASSALATIQNKLRQNLTKLLFKSLEELFQRRLMKENFVRVGEYFVLSPEQDPSDSCRPQQSSNAGCLGIRFKFFVSGDDNPVLAFHTKIVRTHLHPLPSASSAWSVAHSNSTSTLPPILVVAAPCGIAGYLANPTELARNFDPYPHAERDHTISQWKKLHNIVSTSVVGVNIAGSVYQFPRNAIFLLGPPIFSSSPFLVRQSIPTTASVQLTPLQVYHELNMQEFGSVSASSTQKTTLFDAIDSNWTIPRSENVIESLAGQAQALASSSIPWKPKKKNSLYSHLAMLEEDDFDFSRDFPTDSLVSQASMGMSTSDVNDETDVTMGGMLPDENHTGLPDDLSASEMENDVFNEDALVDDWGFASQPATGKVSGNSTSGPSQVVSSNVDAPVPGTTPATQDSLYVTTPGHHLFSPTELHAPRSEMATPFASASHHTPKEHPASLNSQSTSGMEGIVEMMEHPNSGSYDDDSEESSHLSLSDEEDALVHRAWSHTLNHSSQPYFDVCPPSYKSLGMLPKDESMLTSSSYNNMMDIMTPTEEESGMDQMQDFVESPQNGLFAALSDSDSDSDDENDSETTAAVNGETISANQRMAAFATSCASFNNTASVAQHLFDTYQEEPSTLFTGQSSTSTSFAPRSFALTAWARLSQYANGDSARLCFVSHLCNFFETTTGALIANYWPLLYNSEVFFKASNSQQASALFTPQPLGGVPTNGLIHHHVQQLGHHHNVTRNDAISNTSEVILSETLDREAFNIHSPLQGFADTTWRSQSDLCVDVFRMYFKLDQTRLTLWNQAITSAGTPHITAPGMTPNTMLMHDEIFSAEWSSLSGTQIGPMTTEDWLHGRNPSHETSSRKPQFTSKWSGSFESTPFFIQGGNFSWPLEYNVRNTEQMFLLSQLSHQIFGNNCLGPGTRVSGPTPLPMYQQLLSGSLNASSSSSSMNVNAGNSIGNQSHPAHYSGAPHHGGNQHGHHSSQLGNFTQDKQTPINHEVEVMTDPVAIVRYGEEGSMELPPTALYAWEKLNLRPLSPPKDVTFFVLAPAHISHSAMTFFRQLSAVYTQCNLGSHCFDSSLSDTAGVIPCPFPSGIDTFNRQLQTGSSNGHGNGYYQDSNSAAMTPNANQNGCASSADIPKLAWGATAFANSQPQVPTISPFAITEEQLKSFEEWAIKLAERLATTRQYNKSIIIYVVSPFTLESTGPTFAGDARSVFGSEISGLTRAQQLLAQRSAITLLKTVWAAVRKSNVRNLIVHGVSQNRVSAPIAHISHLKETAFNVYTKCRRVLLGEASRDQREPPKLYEPLYVLGKPSPTPSPILGAPPPMMLPREQEVDFTLHAAYVVTSRTMTWSLCDSAGEILECSTLPTYSTITLALVKLLEKVVQTLVDVGHKWRIVIGKWGLLSPGERDEWQQAIKENFGSKSSSQLVEQVALVSLHYATSLDVVPSSVFPIIAEQPLNASTTGTGPAQIYSDQRYSVSQYGNIDTSSTSATAPGINHQGSTMLGASGQQFEASKTIAIYDSKPDTDSWDNELLAQSHLVTFNPQWQHGSLWSSDCPVPLTTSLYQVFQISRMYPGGANAGGHSFNMTPVPGGSSLPGSTSTPGPSSMSSGSLGNPSAMKMGGSQSNTSASSQQIEPTTEPSVINPTIRHITRHYHQLSWLNMSPVSISRVDHLPIHYRLVRKLSNLHHTQAQQ